MHSHTGCICLSFLQYVFSYVYSKHLAMKMHNHTGYICLFVLHCVFSDVNSKHLPMKMRNHIGCTCLSFPRCVFLSVSLNCPHQKRQSPLVAFVCFFSTVCFQMSSQTVCPGGCIVTLGANVRLFSNMHFHVCP